MRLWQLSWVLGLLLPFSLYPLTIEEKVGQLLVGALYPDPLQAQLDGCHGTCELETLHDWIEEQHLGAVLLKGRWDVHRQAEVILELQQQADRYLLIAQDAEWGLAMRHPGWPAYPYNYLLQGLDDPLLFYLLGRAVGRECRLTGINFNLAPVADLVSDPEQGVIGYRSFGPDPEDVAWRLVAWMKGVQSTGVLACVKHFPGHGATADDSHLNLPIVEHAITRLHNVELVPFRAAIENGVQAVMTGHLLIPAWDPQYPASLSPMANSVVLREQLQFDGIVITDDLVMSAITDSYNLEEAALLALKAGADLLMVSHQIAAVHTHLVEAVYRGELLEEELDLHLARVERAREWAHSHPDGVLTDPHQLNLKEMETLRSRLRVAKPSAR
jgi:beta-N-acetylhexosaminidase